MSKKIVITGATGLIGKALSSKLLSRGDELTVFTRSIQNTKKTLNRINVVEWDYEKPDEWIHHLEGKDSIVHLAGVNLFRQRWSDEFKKEIIQSRSVSTSNISKAINKLKIKPGSFITASAIGYYGESGEKELVETSPPGNDFLASVCKVWETSTASAEASGVRVVNIRTGIVLSTKEGALKQMLTPFRFFVGGPLGNGRQWFSWIHIEDVAEAYIHAIDNKTISGPVNAVSPNPVRMKEFAKTLGNVLNRPSLFSVPKAALKLLVGESGEVVTYSQKVIPAKLMNSGFSFRFTSLQDALTDLIKKKG